MLMISSIIYLGLKPTLLISKMSKNYKKKDTINGRAHLGQGSAGADAGDPRGTGARVAVLRQGRVGAALPWCHEPRHSAAALRQRLLVVEMRTT